MIRCLRLVDQADGSGDGFLQKLKRQLDGAPSSTVQLAAELLYFHLLIASNLSKEKKLDYVTRVLALLPDPPVIAGDLQSGCGVGISNGGTAFNTFRKEQLRYLIEFVQSWKRQSTDQRAKALADPWKFEKIADAVRIGPAQAQRNALLHLVLPDTFEPLVSREVKEAIARAFASLIDDRTVDLDRQLCQIRSHLEPRYGADFHFFRADVKQRWVPDTTPMGELAAWAARFFYWDGFDREEREYKLLIADRLQSAREAVLDDSADWLPAVRAAFKPPNILTPFQTNDNFLKWCAESPEAARAALRDFWEGSETLADRIRAFSGALPAKTFGGRTPLVLASFFATAIDRHQYPIYRPEAVQNGFKLAAFPVPPSDSDLAGLYDHYLGFLDELLKKLQEKRVPARDRLDAQSLVWSVAQWPIKDEPIASWPADERAELVRYRGDKPANPGPDLASLADRLLLDEGFLARIARLIEAKRQVIFYGPPGTGKTYVAREMARAIAGETGRVEIVQFHPAYAYEDFIEGYRPAPAANGQPGFVLVEGPLKRAAWLARSSPEATHVLVIDEINRGNLPKVFGELYYLLEYREDSISLQYSAEPFSLPANLRIIGTMNTADRSIALLDAALRRRFYFIPFFPSEPPLADLLARWLQRNKPDLLWVADLVRRANDLLKDRDAMIGPSYFMRPDLTEEWVEIIWQHAIMPYLEDRFYGDDDRLQEFALERLMAAPSAGV